METGKFIGLLMDNKIAYDIDEKAKTIEVYTSSKMSQNYVFKHIDKDGVGTVIFSHTIAKWNESFRKGTEIGIRFLHNLEFAPHRITGKRKAL